MGCPQASKIKGNDLIWTYYNKDFFVVDGNVDILWNLTSIKVLNDN